MAVPDEKPEPAPESASGRGDSGGIGGAGGEGTDDPQAAAVRAIESALASLASPDGEADGPAGDGAQGDGPGGGTPGVEWENPSPGHYVIKLPGTRKLSTTCSLVVGRHSLSVNAFVIRRPDENHAEVHRWLLERNSRLFGVAYAIDQLGDIYLAGKLPLAAVTADELDRVLGAVLEQADGSFNLLLEKGFATAIRKEYAWRTARGESTRNLDAFRHLTQPSG